MWNLDKFKKNLNESGAADWSLSQPLEFFWVFKLKSQKSRIWTFLSDTSRLNREMGFGERSQKEDGGKLIVETKMLGLPQKWIESPWTWMTEQTLTSTRHYLRGFAKTMYSVFHVHDDGEHRYIFIYFSWNPKNLFWSFFLRSTAPILEANFRKAFAKIDAQTESQLFSAKPLNEIATEKLLKAKTQLRSKKLRPDCVDLLVESIAVADDFDLEPIRIIPLAKKWSLKRDDLLATCLHATRLGLLRLSWDVICPHCRISRYNASSLGDIPELSDCDVCDIEFTTDAENSIEVTFHVHPSIRKIEALAYCAAEPAKKTHILAQQFSVSGQLKVKLVLPVGTYRIRGTGWQSNLEIGDFSSNAIDVSNHESNYQAPTQFDLEYKGEPNELLVIEETAWQNRALKPSHVLGLPEFRDLFSEEHLSSNVKLYLGEQTILFTDIVGSTKFYDDVGDAKAFSEVRTHFQEVFSLVLAHGGVIVKTIGDSVMASFQSPIEAIDAAVALQKIFHLDRSETSIRLRISLHFGPVIAVHLNTGLDYFGSTVNYAAKIQSAANACEVALSEKMFRIYETQYGQTFRVDRRKHVRDGGLGNDIYVLRIVEKVA